MRRTITISVSDEMHSLIHKGMRSRYYSTVSEYMRFLVRRDQAPDTVLLKEPTYKPPQTMNEYMEEIRCDLEARNEAR